MNLTLVIIIICCFSIISIIQIALAFGAPWGEVAWGGKYKGVLPKNLRIMSGLTLPIFVFGILSVLDQGQITSIFPNISKIVIWIFAVYLTLNTVLNILSPSKYERYLSGFLSATSAICLYILAIVNV